MHVSELWRTALRPALFDVAEISDAELLQRFRDARDAVAFEVLVHRHGPMVWGACRRIIGNHHAAEDAFQATFLALARRSGRIRSSVPAWLHRVAVRAGLDVLRRVRPGELPQSAQEPVDDRPGPLERATAAELAAKLDAAIERLPHRLGQAFVLCDLHGHSLKEAAAHLNCPVGTVESRLARARQKLRRWLAGLQPAVGGALAVVAVPRGLRAATVRTALDSGALQPAIAALAARAAVGTSWGLVLPGLAAPFTAALLAVAVALGQPVSPAPKAPAPVEKPDAAPAQAPPSGAAGELPPGASRRLGSSRFRHAGMSVGELAFSPDGEQVAVGDDLGVSVFDTQTGKRVHYFACAEGQTAKVVRFVANGNLLAIGSWDGRRVAALTMMDLATGKQVGASTFIGTNQIYVIDVTTDGKRVLVTDHFQKVFLWDIATAQEMWAIKHPEATFIMPFTADGKSFVVAMSRKAELRDALTSEVTAEFPSPGPKFGGLYNAAAISRDGKLASASQDGEAVAILDARGAKSVQRFKAGHQIYRLLFSPDGHYLVGFGELGTLVWDATAADDSRPVARLPGARQGGFSTDGKLLALDDIGFISLWRAGDWKLLPQSADPAAPVHSVRFSADGKRVLGYTQLGWLSWPLDGGPATRLSDESRVYHEGLSDVSANARVGADVLHEPAAGNGTGKCRLRVTDFETGKSRRIDVDQPLWHQLAVSADGRFVSASLQGSAVVAWDTATGEEVLRQKSAGDDPFLNGIQLAKDGKSVARSVTGVWKKGSERDLLAPAYSAVYVTDHVTKHKFIPDPLPWSIYSGGVQFSDDGSKVIIVGRFDADRRGDAVAIWDVRSGRRLLFWPRRTGLLESVRLSPDGRSMTIGDKTGKLAIVEIASGQERKSFTHGGTVLSAAFSADGTQVVASSPEAPVYIWDLRGAARKWDAQGADALWAALAATDAKLAFTAMQTLRANPVDALALLKNRVQLPAVPPEAKIAAWLKQLDSSAFEERDLAQKELTTVAELIQPHLKAARKDSSLEFVRRIELIQSSIANATPERLRSVRACEVLEGIGTFEAAALLKHLAAGPAGSRLTAEAADSADRLARR